MTREHRYSLHVRWTGNTGQGTVDYRSYSRDHLVEHPAGSVLLASSDAAFRGDPDRWNPELLLLAALAQCHMLWYLHLAAQAGVVVVAYRDDPSGTMAEDTDGGGQFTEVVLRPLVTISPTSDPELTQTLHRRVGEYCFIARSVNFPVVYEPRFSRATPERHGAQ